MTLDPGRYLVLMQITAHRSDMGPTEEAVREYAATKRQKLFQIGLQYDLAHVKGLTGETDLERHRREAGEQRRRESERRRKRDAVKLRMQKQWICQRKSAFRNEMQGRILSGEYGYPELGHHGLASGATNNKPDLHVRTDLRMPRPNLETRLATNRLELDDVHLLEGFEFDSDIDMPPEDEEEDQKNRNPEPSAMPWGPVCIVGLRVYSKDPELSVEIVHTDQNGQKVEGTLDVDHQAAASATTEFGTWFTRDVQRR